MFILRYDAILFDVSDTLIEYRPNYAQIYGERLRRIGYKISEEKTLEIARAVNYAIGEQALREEAGEPHILDTQLNILLDRAALSCITNSAGDIENNLMLLSRIPLPEQELLVMAGVIEVLTALQERYRLAIVSNHYGWLMDYLKQCGLSSLFKTIIISEMVGVSKPNVRIMEIALERLGLKAEHCLYVGDQPNDVLCSKQAGLDCVWIAPKDIELPASIPYQADYRITKITELLKIL